MYQVIKRDGKVVDFDVAKISNAIKKAFDATGRESDESILSLLALRVSADFSSKIKDNKISVEDIQDSVEKVLSETGYDDVAKAYILYRKQHETIRNLKHVLDYKSLVDGYVKAEDWRVRENSTVTYSLGGLILSNSGAVTANYWLNEIYDKEIADAHKNCEFHIHDLSMLSGYCAGWSLRQLIQEGIHGVGGRIASKPASHLSTLCNQMVNFLGIMQNEWAGAQAFSSFDTYLAPFVRADKLDYKQVKQAIQSFVYGVNTPSRWGCVDKDTELLTVEGFKKYSDLKKGEKIYTWNNGVLEVQPINEIVIKPHNGVLHEYKANGYNQTVTPDHRVLCKKHNVDEYEIKRSEDIFGIKTPYYLPTRFKDSSLTNSSANEPLSDSEVQMAAVVYCDGNLDYRKDKIHKVTVFKSPKRDGNDLIVDLANELGLKYSFLQTSGGFGSTVNKYVFYGESARKLEDLIGKSKKVIDTKFLSLNTRQSEIFLRTWSLFDGRDEKFMLQYDNDNIKDSLQHIALRAGFTSYVENRPRANYVKIRTTDNIAPTARTELVYNDIVWCPNVDNGTAVFRKNNCVFISGQCQAPFTNVTLDWTVPEDMKDQNAIVGGKQMDFTYGDCKKEMDMINKAFIEVLLEGDADGRGFQYPIPTYSITKDFDWSETENNRLLFGMTAKYGTPYFSNYVNSDMKPSDIRSMCCRLRLDLTELRRKNGGFFGSGESTGSVGVVTINMPRLAYTAKNKDEFYKNLDRLMDIAARSLDIKRRVITDLLNNGLYPYTKKYLGNFNNHFSTIGLVGMNECCLNSKWLGKPINEPESQEFTKEVLNHMRDRLVQYQEKYGCLFNLEATPAESTTYRFAKHDKEDFPSIITAAKDGEDPFYTNSSHLPVGYTEDIFEALDIQDQFQTLYTSGTVFHCFLGEKLPDWKAAANLVKKISDNYKLPYYTMSPTYSICPEHGYITGEHYTCPKCGKRTEVWSRITGYYRPVQNWNNGKKSEFTHRKEYVEETSIKNFDEKQHGVSATGSMQCNENGCSLNRDKSSGYDKPVMFIQDHCPKCKGAEQRFNAMHIEYEVVNCTQNPEVIDKYMLDETPTIIDPDGTRYVGANAAIEWIKNHK